MEFLPEELENIEAELIPDLESISPEKVAKDLETYFEAGVLEGNTPSTMGRKNAVDVSQGYKQGTVGAVVHNAVKPFAQVFGDF